MRTVSGAKGLFLLSFTDYIMLSQFPKNKSGNENTTTTAGINVYRQTSLFPPNSCSLVTI